MTGVGLFEESAVAGAVAAHDPGGKVRLPLLPGMHGDAFFSDCGRYRHWLSREWGPEPRRFALMIGMNPSTAEKDVDDPTIRRDLGFVQSWGLNGYLKGNVANYRSTSPRGLTAPGVVACSRHNFMRLRVLAQRSEKVVMVHGIMPKPLRHLAEELTALLRTDGVDLWCLGRTKHGYPRHTLYLRSDTALEKF